MKIDWTRIDADRFEELCHDLVRLRLPSEARASYQPSTIRYRGDRQRDGVLAQTPFDGLEPPIFFSFKTSDAGAVRGASKAITDAFLKRIALLLADRPRSIVLLANHDISENDRRRIRDKIGTAAEVRIEGRSEIEQRLRDHPYLLTTYFKWSEFVECLRSEDVEALWKALPGSGGALATAVPPDGLRHPSLDAAHALGRRLRILGGPGSGKSFFVFQLLKQLPPSVILILRSLNSAEVVGPIREVAAWAQLPLVILIDNLHRSLTPTAACDALPLLFESEGLASKVCATFVTYWTSVRLEVEARIPSTTWHHWGFEEICLDDPPRSFIRSVVDAACSHLEIRADEAIREAFVDAVVDYENTPACAVASVTPYAGKVLDSSLGFYPVDIHERELDWHRLFEHATRNDAKAKSVLRTLAVLRLSGLSRPRPELLATLLKRLEDLSAGDVNAALERLQGSRWIRLDSEGVSGHDLQLSPKAVRLYDANGPAPFLRQFADSMMASTPEELGELRRVLLNGLGRLFWQAADIEACARINALLCEEDAVDQQARVHLGLCRLRQGAVEEGLADLRAAIEAQPERRFVSLYIRQCLRHGRQEAAVAVLDSLAARRPADLETAEFLGNHYADAGDPRKGLPWARRVAKLRPDDPRSAASLAEILWLSGGRRRPARTTLNCGLERWPADGRLLSVKAIFDHQEGLAEAALESASAALAAQPNEPRNHSLVAILQFQLDRFEDAQRSVTLGRKLFSEWPELLAIEGLLLLRDGKISEARERLKRTLEHQELLGSIIRPNIFLALGRIALLSGEREEADRWLEQARSRGVPSLTIIRLRVGVHEEQGDFLSAIAELQEYLQQHEAEALDWSVLGQLLSRAGRYREAAEATRRARELEPQDAEIALALGSELCLAGEPEEALSHLEAAMLLGPEEPRQAALILAECLINLGRLTDAVQPFAKADLVATLGPADRIRYASALAGAGDLEGAEVQLERALKETPNNFRALIAKALLLQQLGKEEMAREAALAAKASWAGGEVEAGMLAERLADTGLIDAVLEVWQLARKQGWDRFALSQKIVYKALPLLAAQRRFAEMLELLEHCEKAHGFDDATDLNVAHVLRWMGRVDDALARYDALLGRSPLLMNVVVERASLLASAGRAEEALSEESDLYSGLSPWLKHLYLAHVYAWAAGRDPQLVEDGLQKAAEEILRCARSLPDPPPTGALEMVALIDSIERLGVRKLVEAAVENHEGSTSNPDAASGLYLMAFLMKDEGESLRRLRLAHERDPGRVTLLGSLAKAESRAGDNDEALRHARALAGDPKAGCWGLGRAAQVLLEAGAPAQEALATAERAIVAAAPGDHSLPGALQGKAAALNALSRWNEALESGREALKGRDIPEYVATVAQSLIGLGQHEEALSFIEEGLRHHSGDVLLSIAKADLLDSTGKHTDLVAFIEEMAEQGNLAPLPLIRAAGTLFHEGRHLEALDLAQRARELVDRLEAHAKERAQDTMTPPIQGEVESRLLEWRARALGAIVSALLELGRKQEAMDELEALAPAMLFSTPLWLAKAQILRDSGRIEELLHLARGRQEIAPADPWACSCATEALLSLGDLEECVREAEAGLEHGQDAPGLHHLRAMALAQLERFEEAVVSLARAMASSLLAGNQVSEDHGKLVAAWLSRCKEPPVVGAWLAVIVLGVACGTVGQRRLARTMLRLIEGLDLRPLQSAAENGDSTSRSALEVLSRARRFLRGEAAVPRVMSEDPVWKQERDPHWETMMKVLHFLVHSPWPPLSKRSSHGASTSGRRTSSTGG